jgi:hypothetical protein
MTGSADGTALPKRRQLRRVGVGLFFASVACNAVIAIYALVAPGFGSTEGRILGTSLYVTAAILLVLACEPALERGLVVPVPLGASLFGIVGFALLIAVLWAGDEPPQLLLKFAGTAMTVAIAGMLVSLLALARLAGRFNLARTGAYALTALAGVMIVIAIWAEPQGSVYPRILGVVLVALAALVVTIPVLHRLSRTEIAAAERAGAVGQGIAFCPGCGGRLPTATGSSFTCDACGRAFTVLAGGDGTVRPAPERPLALHA